jgi:hypothetical protein
MRQAANTEIVVAHLQMGLEMFRSRRWRLLGRSFPRHR